MLPSLICAAAVVAHLARLEAPLPWRLGTKTLASLAFLAQAAASGAWEAGAPGRWVVAALVASLVGDVALVGTSKPLFLGGLVAFLLGHVGFAAAFLALGVSVPGTAVAALVLGLAAVGVWGWLGPHTGSMRRPVQAYILVISAMVALAFGALAAEPGVPRGLLTLAAVLFFLSDLAVARQRFVAPGAVNRRVGLPLYYAAQLLFAASIAGAA